MAKCLGKCFGSTALFDSSSFFATSGVTKRSLLGDSEDSGEGGALAIRGVTAGIKSRPSFSQEDSCPRYAPFCFRCVELWVPVACFCDVEMLLLLAGEVDPSPIGLVGRLELGVVVVL